MYCGNEHFVCDLCAQMSLDFSYSVFPQKIANGIIISKELLISRWLGTSCDMKCAAFIVVMQTNHFCRQGNAQNYSLSYNLLEDNRHFNRNAGFHAKRREEMLNQEKSLPSVINIPTEGVLTILQMRRHLPLFTKGAHQKLNIDESLLRRDGTSITKKKLQTFRTHEAETLQLNDSCNAR